MMRWLHDRPWTAIPVAIIVSPFVVTFTYFYVWLLNELINWLKTILPLNLTI